MKNPKIKQISTFLPPRIYVEDAIKAGQYSNAEADLSGYKEICVEKCLFPAEMALTALRACIDPSYDSQRVSSLTYSYIHFQGQHDFWSPGAYLANQLGFPQDVAVSNVKQGCNGMMLAADQACNRLRTQNTSSEWIVCADRFDISPFDRWRSDYHIVYGDAACAIEIAYGDTGEYEILHIETVSSWELEQLHRHSEFTNYHPLHTFDVRACKKAYLKDHGNEKLQEITSRSILKLLKGIDASCFYSLEDIKSVVTPNLGINLITQNYLAPFLPFTNIEYTNWGATLGHLGCADCFISLDLMNKSGALNKGDIVLLLGAGAGFTWTSMLVRKL